MPDAEMVSYRLLLGEAERPSRSVYRSKPDRLRPFYSGALGVKIGSSWRARWGRCAMDSLNLFGSNSLITVLSFP